MSFLVPIILAIALATSFYGQTGTVWLDDQTQQSDKANKSEEDSSKDKNEKGQAERSQTEKNKTEKNKSDEKINSGQKHKSGKSSAPSKAKADAVMERLE